MGQASIKKSGSNIHLELTATTFDSFVTATVLMDTSQRPINYKCTPTMPTSVPCFEVALQSDPDNTADIYIGNQGGCYIQLTPGDVFYIKINDVAKVYARTESGNQRINWFAMT